MPELEKLQSSGHMTDRLADYCKRVIDAAATHNPGQIGAGYIQRQIDLFIADEKLDENQATPGKCTQTHALR